MLISRLATHLFPPRPAAAIKMSEEKKALRGELPASSSLASDWSRLSRTWSSVT